MGKKSLQSITERKSVRGKLKAELRKQLRPTPDRLVQRLAFDHLSLCAICPFVGQLVGRLLQALKISPDAPTQIRGVFYGNLSDNFSWWGVTLKRWGLHGANRFATICKTVVFELTTAKGGTCQHRGRDAMLLKTKMTTFKKRSANLKHRI